jgi:hypothetical protein
MAEVFNREAKGSQEKEANRDTTWNPVNNLYSEKGHQPPSLARPGGEANKQFFTPSHAVSRLACFCLEKLSNLREA